VQARSLIDTLIDDLGSVKSRTPFLGLVNNAQNQILGVDNRLMLVTPDPYFRTTAGVYTYVANTAIRTDEYPDGDAPDIRNVICVYVPISQRAPWLRHRGVERITSILAGVVQSAVPGADDCKVSFRKSHDPGTTTDTHLARAYRWPKQLTDEDMQMEVPEDFVYTLLYQTVMMMLERAHYGAAEVNMGQYRLAQNDFLVKYGTPVPLSE